MKYFKDAEKKVKSQIQLFKTWLIFQTLIKDLHVFIYSHKLVKDFELFYTFQKVLKLSNFISRLKSIYIIQFILNFYLRLQGILLLVKTFKVLTKT